MSAENVTETRTPANNPTVIDYISKAKAMKEAEAEAKKKTCIEKSATAAQNELAKKDLDIIVNEIMSSSQLPFDSVAEDDMSDPKQIWGSEISSIILVGSDDNRRAALNVSNVVSVLDEHWETCGMLGFDEFAQLAVLFHEIPDVIERNWEARKAEKRTKCDKPRVFADDDYTAITMWLQHGGMVNLTTGTVMEAVDRLVKKNKFHPVQQYLEGLIWDGVERLSAFGSDFLGAESNEYTAKCFEIFFVGAVARMFQPGCKMDYMLILEGNQGLGKSSGFNALAGDWFSDNLPHDVSSKDASAHLAGKWIIELAEMNALKKNEAAALKHFVTKQAERFRPAFGRKEVVQPRQCVFVGTTNESNYFKDATGNRRYLPVKIMKIDVERLKADRDQLWAEAVEWYKAGREWWPDKEFEERFMKPEQESRMEVCAWEEVLAPKLATGGLHPGNVMLKDKVAYATLFSVVGVDYKYANDAMLKKMKALMEKLGWKLLRSGGNTRWHRPEPIA